MSKTYVKTNTEITLEKGKLNFFTTDKRFTEAVDNYANAACKIACINKTVKTSISARRTLIDEKVARASKETYVNKTALDAEVKGLNDEIESIQAIASEKIATINKTKMTIGDVDTNMYYGYKEYKEGTLSKNEYVHVIKSGGKQFTAIYTKRAYIDLFYSVLSNMMAKAGVIKSFDFSLDYMA